MTPEDVRRRVAEIKKPKVNDDETNHVLEDRLWADVLEAIWAGSPWPEALAEEALKTREIKFDRWYS